MHYVYLIRSIKDPNQTYIGNTVNLRQRLETHNSGGSVHTMQDRPWELVLFLGFKDKLKATAFEKYLNSGSGRAFAIKRFW
jgi:predicted GIY-YIG superfamily endonuclease